MLKTSYKFRAYPNKEQAQLLTWTIERCRELYNAALVERRSAYKTRGITIDYHDQAKQLPEIKHERSEYKHVHSQVLQETLQRAENAYQRFFQRIREGKKPGFPRLKGIHQYDSITYPQSGFSLSEKHIRLSKIGNIKVKFHREIIGTIKTCTIRQEVDHWYIILTCAVPANPLPEDNTSVGIDLGIIHLATLSDGSTIENPKYYRASQRKLQHLQKTIAQKKRGSNRQKKAKKNLAKLHQKIANQRKDFLHKASRRLINSYGIIIVEDIRWGNLSKRPEPIEDQETEGSYKPNGAAAKSGLNKSLLDAGLSLFITFCSYKAERAGRTLRKVDPRKTSQICSGCGKEGPHKDLGERIHRCFSCGLTIDRDLNAARNILRLGSSLRGETSAKPHA